MFSNSVAWAYGCLQGGISRQKGEGTCVEANVIGLFV